jgi:hypothetical protein
MAESEQDFTPEQKAKAQDRVAAKRKPAATPAPAPNQLPMKVQQANKNAKPYQRHVLFALVSAFVIQLIANGKSLPVKGK